MGAGTGSNMKGKYDGALSELSDFITYRIEKLQDVPQIKESIVHNAVPMTIYITRESFNKAGDFYDIHIIDKSLEKPNIYDALLFMPRAMPAENVDISKYVKAENVFSLSAPVGTSADDLNKIYESSQNHRNIIAAEIEEMKWRESK